MRVRQEEDEEILDSGSTITLTKNKESVENLRQCKQKIIMSTNVGEQRIHEEGEWKEWGESYVCPTALTGIVSISDAVRKGF